jgi:hypothetical protein
MHMLPRGIPFQSYKDKGNIAVTRVGTRARHKALVNSQLASQMTDYAVCPVDSSF